MDSENEPRVGTTERRAWRAAKNVEAAKRVHDLQRRRALERQIANGLPPLAEL